MFPKLTYLTNREYWNYTNQCVPQTKDDELYSGYILIEFENNSRSILSEDELNKIITEDSENA